MRSQFVLDDETDHLLDELATSRAGNRSFVVREAIRLFADLEAALESLETAPGLQRMIERSGADIQAGRVATTRELMRRLAAKRKGRSKR